MRIAGIHTNTLLDYPGHIATMIFTAWCNLRCRFCHNPEFILPEEIKKFKNWIPEEVFFTFLKTRIWLIEWVVICGWEPTLQPDLIPFCKKIKEQWLLVKLDTNGRDPDTIDHMIREWIVDYIAMDIKSDNLSRRNLVNSEESLDPYHKSIALLLQWEIAYEFRTTMIKGHHTIAKFHTILDQIRWARHYYLQSYRSWKILDQTFDGCVFSVDEMNTFRNIALHYVEHCTIR